MQSMDIVISGTGLFTPSESVSNAELVDSFNQYAANYNAQHADAIATGEIEALADSNTAFIEKASGIKKRFVMDKAGVIDPNRMCPVLQERDSNELSLQAEMCVTAAKEAMEQAHKTAADIDTVIVACSNMQRAYPAIAVEVQDALGIDGYGYDMNVACSSATFGIQAAYNAIFSGSANTVLIVNPEICSAHTDWKDRDCHFIFGDACTAIIVEKASTAKVHHCYKILGTKLKTQFSSNIRNNYGFMNRSFNINPEARDMLFAQNGRKVFKEVCPMVAELIVEQLEALNVNNDGIKRLWLHQANLNMNELIAKRVLGREPELEEAPVILDTYANTSSAGSIIAFHLNKEDLSPGDKGVLCSFGAGYSIGSILLEKTTKA